MKKTTETKKAVTKPTSTGQNKKQEPIPELEIE